MHLHKTLENFKMIYSDKVYQCLYMGGTFGSDEYVHYLDYGDDVTVKYFLFLSENEFKNK